MTETPDDFLYTKHHLWIDKHDGIATIGLTDHAQSLMGKMVYIELPEQDAEISKGDVLFVIESVSRSQEKFSPLSGNVVEINQELEEEPYRINGSPYEDGWIVKITVDDKTELDELLADYDYIEYIDR